VNRIALDTMALVLRLEKRKLPSKVKSLFVEAEMKQSILLIPTIVFAEIGYLSEKGKIDTSLKECQHYMEENPNIKGWPLDFQIIICAFEITDIPELHDRLIAATAMFHKIPIVTNDPVIQKSKFVTTLW